MQDKEVGELWRDCYGSTRHNKDKTIIELIRKLVTERREKYAADSEGKWDSLHYTSVVLADFGIPEKDWK